MKKMDLPSLKRFSLIPLAVMVILVAVFALLDVRASFAPPLLFPILQTLLISVIYTIVAYLAAAGFGRSGSWEILLFGVTLLLLGTAVMLAAWFSRWGGLNTNTTIHNTSALLGSVLLLIGMFLANRDTPPVKETSRMPLTILIYGGAIAFMTALTILTLKNLTPTFFEASGPTPLRQILYGTASVLLTISTVWMIIAYYRARADFLYWCCLGFGLIIVGYAGGLFVGMLSDPVSWLCRISLYFSSLYLSIAGLTIRAEARKKQTGFEELVGQFLKQGRFNYENLVAGLTDGIISIDEQGRVLMWNPAAEKMFGYSKGEAVGSFLFNLIGLNERAESWKNRVMSPLLPKNVQPATETTELVAKRRNGEEIPVEISLSRIRPSSRRSAISNPGTITTLVIRDITERKQAEEALRKAHDELELRVKERTSELEASNKSLVEYAAKLQRLNEELQAFAFAAAHDLQEPLRKIQTFCDLAMNRGEAALDRTRKEYLDRVVTSATRMRQLLYDLFEFSRATSKPEPFKEIDLGKIAREAADVFEDDVRKFEGSIEIANMPLIEANQDQMLSLFQNLIGNALKFRSKESPQIKIYAKRDGERCEIFVEDNGIGFEHRYAEQIFKPFKRLHGRKEYEGTGIGLAVCRKITEQHGGSIRAESKPGKGSTFIITLPVKQDKLVSR
jgi:PAS domain S-box-containing protein